MDIRADEISKIIRDQIGGFAADVDVAEVGTVISLADGVARVHGCERAMAGEMLEFPHGVFGIALNLEEDAHARTRVTTRNQNGPMKSARVGRKNVLRPKAGCSVY